MKKFFNVTISLLLAASIFAGCTKTSDSKPAASDSSKAQETSASDKTETAENSSNPNEPNWKKNASKKEKFTWYINFSWFGRKWGADETSKYITEKTGIDVEFIVPAGNEAEKLNTMIASDTLPDIITLWWNEAQVQQIVDAGLVYSLNELADQYDTYFYKVADEQKLNWYRKDDGNVYGYPNASYSPADFEKYKDEIYSNQTFLVRKDIYEAIGSPDMTTPEGFLAALAKAKEQFPTVDGQPLIPLGFNEFGEIENTSFEGYLQNYLGIPFEKDGKVYDRYSDPEYLKWLKTFREANEKGLISKDIFIDKRAQMEEKIAQGRYFAMIYQAQDMLAQNSDRYNKDPNSAYIAVDFAKNSNGNPHTLNGDGISGWTLTMISKNCKAPDRAIEFLTYLISEEGQHDVKLGAPGIWETKDGKDQLTEASRELEKTDKDKFENTLGAENTIWMLMDLPMQQQWNAPLNEPLKQTKEWTTPYVSYNAVYDGIDPDTDTEPAANLTKIKTKWMTILPKLILATSDSEFDKLFKEFTDYREANGFEEIQKIRTEKMIVNKTKLGMK